MRNNSIREKELRRNEDGFFQNLFSSIQLFSKFPYFIQMQNLLIRNCFLSTVIFHNNVFTRLTTSTLVIHFILLSFTILTFSLFQLLGFPHSLDFPYLLFSCSPLSSFGYSVSLLTSFFVYLRYSELTPIPFSPSTLSRSSGHFNPIHFFDCPYSINFLHSHNSFDILHSLQSLHSPDFSLLYFLPCTSLLH